MLTQVYLMVGIRSPIAKVAAAAKMVGIDPNIGLLTAAMESSFNHNASAGKAKGLASCLVRGMT